MAAILALAGPTSCSEPQLYRQERKLRLVGQVRSQLLSSAFVERGAVLAVTDEQSKKLAAEAASDAKKVDTSVAELRGLVREDGNETENASLEAFVTEWNRLKETDDRLLAQAVENTNLKAAALLSREGRESAIAFSDVLEGAAAGTSDPVTLRTIARCQTSALRSLALLLLHVPSESDEEMSRLEALVKTRNEEVAKGLEDLRAHAALPASVLDEASVRWTGFGRIESEALRLSRENSNVTSRVISLDEKPRLLDAALVALDRLESLIDSSVKAKGSRRSNE